MASVGAESRIIRRAATLPQRMAEEPVFFVAENPAVERKAILYSDCRLTPNEARVVFNPFKGSILINSWHHKKGGHAEIQGGKKIQGTIYSRWSEYPDIETAIRGVEHILKKYDKDGGERIQNTKEVIEAIKTLLAQFRAGKVTREKFDEYAQYAEKTLVSAGFAQPEKPIRIQLTKQVRAAAGPDSLGRVNPLISRTRLASAWSKLIRELLTGKMVREKYSMILAVLESERELERFSLEQVLQIISDSTNEPISSYRQADELIKILREMNQKFLSLNLIKVASYRRAASMSSAILFGSDGEHFKKVLIGLIGDEESVNALLNQTPLDQLLNKTYFYGLEQTINEIKRRLAVCSQLIKESLELGEKGIN